MSAAVKLLDNQTARLITSNQVIQGPYNVVKELVENALDAGATAIDIKLENYGLEKITVKDNAKGISSEDVAVMCKPGYSSKIRDFSDLDTLKSYGFRGEALASICCVAEVSITTKTDDDAVASTYKFDSDGEIVDKSASHLNQGTLVTVQNIFYHQPARRRILINARASANTQGFSKCGTMTKIRSYLGAVGVAWPFVRIFLVHGGALVWKKQSVSAENEPIKTAFGETLGHNLVSEMIVLRTEIDDVGAVVAVLPNSTATINEISTTSRASNILIINKRVVRHKKIEDILMEKFKEQFPDLSRGRYPACVLDLKVNQEDLDVNLEPDKSKVLLRRKKEDLLLEGLRAILETVYGTKEVEDGIFESIEMEPPPTKKQKTSKVQESINKATTEIATDIPPMPSHEDKLKSPESNQDDMGFKIDFFTPALVLPDAEPISNTLSIEFIQKPRSEAPEKIDLSEDESSDDEAPIVSSENSLLCTPQASKLDDADFTLTEEDEAALMELEKLMDSSQNSSKEVNQPEELPLVEKPAVSYNLSDWSRGHVEDESGTEIEGFKVLAQPKGSVKHRKPAPIDNREQRLALLASPCTQMGLTNLRAFNMFCKETRPKLLKENKDLGLCEVAPLLARMWKELSSEAKLHFEEQAEIYKSNKLKNNNSLLASPTVPLSKATKKKPVAEPSSPAENLCMSMLKSAAEKKLSQSASETLQVEPEEEDVAVLELSAEKEYEKSSLQSDSLQGPAQEKLSSLAVVEIISKKDKSPSQETRRKKLEKTVEISLTLEQITQKKLDRLSCINKFSKQVRLIGPLNKGWLVRKHNVYSLTVPWKMRETLNFHRLMSEHVLSTTVLNQPVQLDEKALGTVAWKSFNKMLAHDSCNLNSVLLQNGFIIDCGNAILTHTSEAIESYGLVDLQELLVLLSESEVCDTNCRTTKFKKSLEDTSKEPSIDFSRQETLVLLGKYLQSHDMQEHCPHGNSTTVEVYCDIIKSSQ